MSKFKVEKFEEKGEIRNNVHLFEKEGLNVIIVSINKQIALIVTLEEEHLVK
jgi:hypothetical protein